MSKDQLLVVFPGHIGDLLKIDTPLYQPRFSTPGQCLTYYREHIGYSIDRLASEMQVPISVINDYEQGIGGRPNVDFVDSAASVLFPDRKTQDVLLFYLAMGIVPEMIVEILEYLRSNLRDNSKPLSRDKDGVTDLRGRQVFTTGEIAKYCGVNPRTVIRWIERGQLDAYHLPGRGDSRVRIGDFLNFLREYEMPIPEELQ